MRVLRDFERIIFSRQTKDKIHKKIMDNGNFLVSKLGNNVSHLHYVLMNATIFTIFY